MEVSEKIFPEPKAIIQDLTPDYKKLAKRFENDFKKLVNAFCNSGLTFYQFIEALMSLLEIYTWCVPSSTVDEPDIPLYDHLITTAAIATVLFDFELDRIKIKGEKEFNQSAICNRDTNKFLFIAGDLSGIQNYLFDLSRSKLRGISKILRARSFYISTLMDAAARWILYKFELPRCNLLVSAGGRFLILAPNTKCAKNKTKDIKEQIYEWCREELFGELALNISITEASANELIAEEKGKFYGVYRDKIQPAIEKEKFSKLKLVLDSENKFIVEKHFDKIVSNESVCSYCGKRPKGKGNEEESCELCHSQIKVGGKLAKAKYLIYKIDTNQNTVADLKFFNKVCVHISEDIGYVQGFLGKDGAWVEAIFSQQESDLRFSHKRLANYVARWTKEDLAAPIYKGVLEDLEKEGEIPKEGDIKVFEAIAESSKKQVKDGEFVGVPFLGVVRADVDNAGKLFGKSMEKSLSCYVFLSRMLDLFFSSYLPYLAEREYKDLYTVYAGGDDLFLIGPWDKMLDFANKMQEMFKKYVGQNEYITISCGFSMIKPRYPVHKAADLAKDQLDKAKHGEQDKFDAQKVEKNRFCAFNSVVSWEDFKRLLEFGRKLDKWVEDKILNTSFVFELLTIHNMREEADELRQNLKKGVSIKKEDMRKLI